MSITDELLDLMRARGMMAKETFDQLAAIADRIDAEHERQTSGEYLRGANDGYDQGFASADDWLGQHEDAMAEHGWIRLPLDADGVPIHIGDVLDEIAVATYPLVPAKVVGYHECCGEVLPIVENDGEFQVIPEKVCHYHAPTVEDVLREFGDWYAHVKGGCDEDGIVAEYAAKLRMVEGAEQ